MPMHRRIHDSVRAALMQSKGFIPLRYRLGKEYWDIKKFLANAQWAVEDEIRNWQLQRLRCIVEYAYRHVPGYYSLYKEAGISQSDIKSLTDIKLLPFVTKELIRDNLKEFTSTKFRKYKLRYVTTGGSTGIPMGFFRTRSNLATERAFMHLSWERAAWRLGDTSAVLRGAFIGSDEQFWKYDRYNGNVLLSSYFLTEQSYSKYLETIIRCKPRHLQAYPSMATILADLVLARGDAGKLQFDNILLGSENIYQWQRRKLHLAFPGARLFEWYGQSESVILATMCEYSDQYHIWPFYGLTEVYDDNGVEPKRGEVGELVGTSFWNYATPFIRYRTLDTAKMGEFGCDKCHRRFQLLDRIEGRLQEMIVTKSGRYITMTAINMHSDIFDHVKQFQFYQREPGRLVLNIVKKENYIDRDTDKIRSELMHKLGEDVELETAFVEMIPRANSGKYRFLKQDLQIRYGE